MLLSEQSRIFTILLRWLSKPLGLLFMSPASRTIPAVLFLLAQAVPSCAWGEPTLIDRIQNTENSVVTVRTELTKIMHTSPPGYSIANTIPCLPQRADRPRTATFQRTGAGLVIDSSGIIVTNTHIIINAPFIFVYLKDGTKLPAQVLFASRDYDFSFLRVRPPHALQSVTWADSSRITIGEPIIAIGNSDFDNQSILAGHVKGIIQSFSAGTNDFLELDLDLYHGDSGGPVLDYQGRLLGLIMAKRESQQNSSIAIASNKIRQQYLQYKRNMP